MMSKINNKSCFEFVCSDCDDVDYNFGGQFREYQKQLFKFEIDTENNITDNGHPIKSLFQEILEIKSSFFDIEHFINEKDVKDFTISFYAVEFNYKIDSYNVNKHEYFTIYILTNIIKIKLQYLVNKILYVYIFNIYKCLIIFVLYLKILNVLNYTEKLY